MKAKSATVPIIIVLIIGVIAAILIYYVSESAKTTTFSGDTLTVENLSDYEEKIKGSLNIGTEDVNLLYDSSLTVKEDGTIEDMMLKIAINYDGHTEYWKVEEHSDGIKVTYVEKVTDGVCYTLYDLATYLKAADTIVSAAEYTVSFSTELLTGIEYTGTVSYRWNGEGFDRIFASVDVECYAINITVSDGSQYAFYTA